MARTLERYQNPTISDTVNLRLFTYNSNNLTNVSCIERVDIYFLDHAEISDTNIDGRRLVESFDGASVITEDTGTYLLPVEIEDVKYTIGRYVDIWTINFLFGQPDGSVEQIFDIYPNLWYTAPIPIVYDFSFHFQPNKFRKGSKQFLIIEIAPNVPTAGDLRKYYENLAIVSDLKVSIELACGDCVPAEEDLRLIVDKAAVDYREKRYGFYRVDTSDMDCGIYNIWFQLEIGENTYISEKYQIQVYD